MPSNFSAKGWYRSLPKQVGTDLPEIGGLAFRNIQVLHWISISRMKTLT